MLSQQSSVPGVEDATNVFRVATPAPFQHAKFGRVSVVRRSRFSTVRARGSVVKQPEINRASQQ
ncbi:hypothetical protein PSAB6_60332 [Paraburkholderia sabiae]|nr:hypothetical protein PSAB6_60332 [Paraburkholderia sabiae]